MTGIGSSPSLEDWAESVSYHNHGQDMTASSWLLENLSRRKNIRRVYGIKRFRKHAAEQWTKNKSFRGNLICTLRQQNSKCMTKQQEVDGSYMTDHLVHPYLPCFGPANVRITWKRGSAKHSVKDDHAFLWKHAIFRYLPSRYPSPDQDEILHDWWCRQGYALCQKWNESVGWKRPHR
jgi:hypothetical protein